jgi:3-oxoadipate enol-lactonase
MSRLSTGDATLAYRDTGGEGPVVVFVHGLGGTANAWRAQLAACEGRYRGIAYDQRGAGRSDKPPGPYSIELWARDLVGLLDALGIERAALVGHSMGCMVVEHAALELAGRIWGLAMCGGIIKWPEEAKPVFAERAELARSRRMDEVAEAVATTGLSERCRDERPALHGLMIEMIAANDPDAYAESALAVGRGAMRDPASVPCPALAFAGSEDPVTPPTDAEAIAGAIPEARAARVDGAAHWCALEDPAATNRVLFGFLDGLDPGP